MKNLFWLLISSFALFLFLIKPVSALESEARLTFTFDDGAKRIFDNALPIFDEFDVPAVLYGETGPLNSGEDWVMTWDEIRELQNEHNWEIGSHTINHPYLTSLSDEQLEYELAQSKADFADQGINVRSFATPYGDYDERVLTQIAKYYESHRAAWGGFNQWPDNFNGYELVSLEAKHTIAPEAVISWIDEAIAEDKWLVLLLHDVVDTVAEEYEYNTDDLRQIVQYASQSGIEISTVSDALEFSVEPNLVLNYTFSSLDDDSWAENWTRTSQNKVLVNQAGKGDVFEPQHSLRIDGGEEQNEAISDIIMIDPEAEYILEMHQNAQDLAAGGWAVWVDEFDEQSVWLGGQWLGGNYANFIGTRYYSYVPGNDKVRQVDIHIFTESGSDLTLYVDSVFFRPLSPIQLPEEPDPGPTPTSTPNLIDNSSFEQVSGDWALGWTRTDDSLVVIDQAGQGAGEEPQNSLHIVGSPTQNIAISKITNLDSSAESFQFSFYQKISNYESGGAAVWFNEFDLSNSWLSGQWLGGTYSSHEGRVEHQYQPSSSEVAKIEIHVFSEADSNLDLIIDDLLLQSN